MYSREAQFLKGKPCALKVPKFLTTGVVDEVRNRLKTILQMKIALLNDTRLVKLIIPVISFKNVEVRAVIHIHML